MVMPRRNSFDSVFVELDIVTWHLHRPFEASLSAIKHLGGFSVPLSTQIHGQTEGTALHKDGIAAYVSCRLHLTVASGWRRGLGPTLTFDVRCDQCSAGDVAIMETV